MTASILVAWWIVLSLQVIYKLVMTSTLEEELTTMLDTWYHKMLMWLWPSWPATPELICGYRPSVSILFPHLDLARLQTYIRCLSCSIKCSIITWQRFLLNLLAVVLLVGVPCLLRRFKRCILGKKGYLSCSQQSFPILSPESQQDSQQSHHEYYEEFSEEKLQEAEYQ